MTEWLDVDVNWGDGWLVLIAMPPLLIYAYWIYSRTHPISSRARIRILWLLRAVAITCCLVIIAAPKVDILRKRVERPVLIVLIDKSRSMSVTQNGTSRISQVLELVHGVPFVDLSQTMRVIAFEFSDRIAGVSIDTLNAITHGNATNLFQALSEAVKGQIEGVSAVLVLSDGTHNLDSDPVGLADELGVPIYSLGLGSESGLQKDVQIYSVELPPQAYVGQPLRLKASIRSYGVEDTVIVRVVKEGENTLTETTTFVHSDGQLETVDLTLVPKKPGPAVYEIMVSQFPGEHSGENNRLLMPVMIRRARSKVEIVAGAPSPEFIFMQRALRADSTLMVNSAVLKGPSKFYDDLSVAEIENRFSNTQAIVLFDPPPFLIKVFSKTIETLLRRGVGLMVLLGRESVSNWNPASALAKWLPVSLPADATISVPSSAVTVTESGRKHPIFNVLPLAASASRRVSIDADYVMGTVDWSQYPPITELITGTTLKGGSDVLLKSSGQHIATVGWYGNSKVIATCGSGFWKLDFVASGAGESPELIRSFWRNSVTWLTNSKANGRVHVVPERSVFRSGEKVVIHVSVYDEQMEHMLSPEVDATLNGEAVHRLKRLTDGRYRGSWTTLNPGTHIFTARGSRDGESVGVDSTEFIVDTHSLELSDVLPAHHLLKQISSVSGGEFWTIHDWNDGLQRLEIPPRLSRDKTTLRLWDMWWLLMLLVSALLSEWLLRKRSGML